MNASEYKRGLGRAIKQHRQLLGYTSQDEFAASVGLHRTYIGAIERGERNISLENLLRISMTLEMKLSDLCKSAEEF